MQLCTYLRYITVAPTTMTIDAGTTATTYYSDGTRTDATATAAWSSSSPAVATVNASGVASGLTNGTAVITATFGGLSASGTLTLARTLQHVRTREFGNDHGEWNQRN